jgi:hypothetical protein
MGRARGSACRACACWLWADPSRRRSVIQGVLSPRTARKARGRSQEGSGRSGSCHQASCSRRICERHRRSRQVRWLTSLLLLSVLAGCGSASTTPTTTSPAQPTTVAEPAKEAHERATAAKEEAETAALKARADREQASTERREQAERSSEEAKEAARTKAHEHAEAVRRHQEEAHHHTYSAVFQASYLGSCAGGGHESTCACALVKAQERWSEQEFEAQPASALEAIIRECQSEGK